ncbi:MAG: hypothetical protein HKO56_03665 [Bacteroidia bacterium]|nr:hypothetical protein [Bacteroidia bacterium]NNC86758.1 hypothetical protein [Bacteroidia bacterium]NNM15735.1 hypothetical protein [Bacteroidia bacterium]
MNREKDIEQLVNQAIEGTELFIVEIKMTQNRISVFLDKMDGVTIEECVRVHKFLVSELREDTIFETHNFEVSSPGMDQPLRVLQQYKKRVGRELNVITADGTQHTGVLVGANDNGIALKEKVNKEEKEEHYSFDNIKQAKIIL